MRSAPVKPRMIVVIAMALCLLLAACSSDSDRSQATADDTTAEADTDVAGDDTSANDDSNTDNSDTDNGDTDADAESSTDDPADGETATASVSPIALSSSDRLDSYSLANEEFGTVVTVTVDADSRVVETNALPDHETGEFPTDGNPNTISAQDLTWEFPASPTWTGEAIEVGITGVAVNGVKFEPGTAETVSCDSGETYRVEGLQDIYNLGMDFNNAHVQPSGEYHYHGISELLVDAYANDDDLVHIGFAGDGYLVYYSKSNAYASSYLLDADQRSGTNCVGSGALEANGVGEIEVDGTSPDGTFTSDWIYTEGAGDLDSCNGTTIDGQYAYLVIDSYPYISRCLNGDVTGVDGIRAGGGGAPDGTEGGRS